MNLPMARFRNFAAFALAVAVCLPGMSQTAPKHKAAAKRSGHAKKAAKKKAAPEPAPVAQQPPAPPPPSRLYEMPPVAPQVTYNNGLLTISASNSTLSDILRQVQQRTGAKVDMPPDTAQERVAVELSGAPRDVLARLLEGSPFDYLLLGSDSDPRAVTQVTLTRHTGGGAPTAVAGVPNRAPMQPEPADEDEAEQQPPPQQQIGPPRPPAMQPPTGQAPEQVQNPQMNPGLPTPTPGQTVPGQPPNTAKTPEQLLQELRQMQQQEQQRRPQRPPPQ